MRLIQIAAEHEAAHVTMKYVPGVRIGYISVSRKTSPGRGYCSGCSQKIRTQDAVLITLAGIAWEGRGEFYEKAVMQRDWHEVVAMPLGQLVEHWDLTQSPYQLHPPDLCAKKALKRAWLQLEPHQEQIKTIARELIASKTGRLKGEKIKEILCS